MTQILLRLALLLGAGAAHQTDSSPPTEAERAAVQATFEGYVDALLAGNLAQTMQHVATDAPQRAEIEAFLAARPAPAGVEFAERRVAGLRRVGGRLRARYHFQVRWKQDEMVQSAPNCFAVKFSAEDGKLRIWELFSSPIVDFASQLFETPDSAARERLLADEPPLVNLELLSYLQSECLGRYENGQRLEGEKIRELHQRIAVLANDPVGLAQGDFLLGSSEMARGRFREAGLHFARALDRSAQTGEQMPQVIALHQLALSQANLGEYDKALQFLADAERLVGTLISADNRYAMIRSALAETHGSLLIRMTDYEAARKAGEEALRLAREGGGPLREIAALRVIGGANLRTGRTADAISQYHQALSLLSDEANPEGVALVHQELGVAYIQLGRYEEAGRALDRSMNLFERIGLAVSKARVQVILAGALIDLEQFEAAWNLLTTAFAPLNEAGDSAALLLLAQDMALALDGAGRTDEAEQVLAEIIAESRQRNMRDSLGFALLCRASLDLRKEKFDQAQQQFTEVLALAQESHSLGLIWRCRVGLGQVAAAQNKWDNALAAFQQAVDLIEQERANIVEPGLQRSLMSERVDVYGFLANAALKQGDSNEAFLAIEKSRARTLVDLLQQGPKPVDHVLSAEERLAEQAADLHMRNAEARWRQIGQREGDDAEQANRKAVDEARNALDALRQQLYLQHPGLRDQRAEFRCACAEDLDKDLFAHETGLVLVSYFVGKDETLLFCQSRNGPSARTTLQVEHIPRGREYLTRATALFRHRCASAEFQPDPSKPARYEATAELLYRELLAPIESRLADCRHLVIVPDGPLHHLPFQVLRDAQGQHLIERFPVSYAPSATALMKMIARAKERGPSVTDGDKLAEHAAIASKLGNARGPVPAVPSALVIGRPQLPAATADLGDLKYSEDEARQVAALLGVTPRLGTEASRELALRELPGARYAHIACHSVVDDRSPLHSFLALASEGAGDGILFAHELMNFDLAARLVVLSACRTAGGEIVRGEGVLGLSWALFRARAPTCVLSQWPVDDCRTVELMKVFYAELLGGEVTKAEALRRAQCTLMKQPEYRHPEHWGAFVLLGAWGS